MKKIIVTGACGFIGTCLTKRLIELGYKVFGVDSLKRAGSEINFQELSMNKNFNLFRIDLSNSLKVDTLFKELGEVDAVFHLAAQVTVTTSYTNRQQDFLDNAIASFNVIESVKKYSPNSYAFYASTNKVYGHINVNKPVNEDYPIDPYTPYGVSKATGELYFKEYGRKEIGMNTCVLRQSCIYGHQQFGVEDQGWVAWFAIANIFQLPLTLYGNGKQVRDLLFVDDLIDFYILLLDKRKTGVFPIGGGSQNSINLLDAIELITSITGNEFPNIEYEKTRPGDQPYFVSDNSWVINNKLDWKPKVNLEVGIGKMIKWIQSNEQRISGVLNLYK